MKKKIWTLLAGILVLTFGVFVIGVWKRNTAGKNENSIVTADMSKVATVGDADVNGENTTEELDDGEAYSEQLKKNQDLIEEYGNIFPKSSSPIFNGYRYMIKEFQIYDSYDKFKKSMYYNSDYEYYEPNLGTEEGKLSFLYAEVEITNIDEYEKTFGTGNLDLICAENEKQDKDGYEACPSDNCYASKVENWRELSSKQWDKFTLQEGESVTLKIGMGITYWSEDQGWASIDEVFEHPRYYLSVYGNAPMNGQGSDLRKNLAHIYIELEDYGNEAGK